MTFWQLAVPTSPETADGLTNFLWEQGALGVVEEEAPGEPARLRAFFPATAAPPHLLGVVDAYRASLAQLGFAVSPIPAEVTELLDGAWADAWRQSFPPLEVGAQLLVLPPWESRPPGPRRAVIIEPGRAFGTGHHGSTEGCLALLETALAARDGAPPAVLDIGTGTGILAIAAVALGAPRALGVDVDADAIAAARQNAERNGVAGRITVILDDVADLPSPEPFGLVVANLLTHTHVALAPRYARLVAPGGQIILGGILAEDAERVDEALRGAGFAPETRLVIDGWASILFRRLAPA